MSIMSIMSKLRHTAKDEISLRLLELELTK